MVRGVLDLWYDLTNERAVEETVAVEAVERRADERWRALGQVELHWIDQDGNRQSAQASMVERSLDGLRIRAPMQFTVGDEIHVSLPKEEHDVKANVRHGEACGQEWHIGLRFVRQDRRRFQRLPAEGLAIMQWSGPNQHSQESLVEVCNLAEEGMQLRVPEAVVKGTAVKVLGRTMQCVGVIWYCRPEGKSYLVGMQLSRDPCLRKSLDFND